MNLNKLIELYKNFYDMFKMYYNEDISLFSRHKFIIVTFDKIENEYSLSTFLGYIDLENPYYTHLQLIHQVKYEDYVVLSNEEVLFNLYKLLIKSVFTKGFEYYAKMYLQFGGDEDDYFKACCITIDTNDLSKYSIIYSYEFEPDINSKFYTDNVYSN